MAPKSRRVPQELRQRTEKSCDRCKSRKQKCGMLPGKDKCAHCAKYGYNCLVTKPRKQRLYGSVEAHTERLVLLEGLVKHFVPDADLTGTDGLRELTRSLGVPLFPGVALTSPHANTNTNINAHSQRAESGQAPADDDTDNDAVADPSCTSAASSILVKAKRDNEMLVLDLQGQGQYIGQASSFFFQVRLRDALETWIGRDDHLSSAGSPSSSAGTPGRMLLFGPNPADDNRRASLGHRSYPGVDALMVCFPQSLADLLPGHPPAERWAVTQLLVRTFFDRVNSDFPVLHEATFLEQLGAWSRHPHETDQAWVCTLLCVLMLAWRLVAPTSVATSMPEAMPESASAAPSPTVELHYLQETRWWHQAQALLPKVLFTSSMASVQALMLTALHLHNNNSRDVCWTLTGAAVRIGFAIGLHRDDVVEPAEHASAAAASPTATATNTATPVTRELRKRVWWTLYAFEQLQVSSHDRPSAIDCTKHLLAGAPRETILGMGAHNPPEYVVWSNRLVTLLGAACRSLPPEGADCGRDKKNRHPRVQLGPLSPAAGLLHDLDRWQSTLPRHLSADLIGAMPPSFQRPLLLLHVQYSHVSALVSRHALLARFAAASKRVPLAEPVRVMADVCVQAGRLSCDLLLQLDAVGCFNALTWMDVYYLYSSVLIVVLAFVCEEAEGSQPTARQTKETASTTTSTTPPPTASDLRQLLGRCKTLAAKHLANPVVPGTMRRWLTVVGELDAMASYFARQRGSANGDGRVPTEQGHPDESATGDALPNPPLMTPSPDSNSGGVGNTSDNDVEEVPRPVYDEHESDYRAYNRRSTRHRPRQTTRSQHTDRHSSSHNRRSGRINSNNNNSSSNNHNHNPNHNMRYTQSALLSQPLSLAGDADYASRQLMMIATSSRHHPMDAMDAMDAVDTMDTVNTINTLDTMGMPLDLPAAADSTATFFSHADGSTAAATAATTALLDGAATDDYGPFQAAADAATETGLWHEMHWEGISDLLLGVDSRSWGA
ncbi:c6 zinc finger domain containing protein [Sporothrix brasiliensis 5110]|uniref:C6 zinc finger domain containing protein n=1 Tax=Sporothrix brasiliensis 5110 TaxID=1398154 RepID=A0A0C2F8X6_9PEZI|nr:c6 zinc finger domain containing protein [Sporothrix brasiliensis 5110]KIH87538.1 c6 zinc finger domain containing protein [Sporothrix brasiliensis 5110]